ncbi:P63C domain-containing protein [Saccharopolyspora sp. WRP15-2]|uniref:P63C domain-containing protein n=1 Tax=Saccharopolyspora oryzae TaxID=2997343 RepID=A0ABT4UXM8_9PSEU|nr:P63C domain-containing protein [Saccharopolyspora oryzae]MDA3626466.1 P63C domain-containing protein [Saccharopolyspora oryzae]
MAKPKNPLPRSPFAKHVGQIQLGNNDLDCYVLDSEIRVLALRSAVRALTGVDGSDLDSYIGVQNLRDHLDSRRILASAVEFSIPGTQFTGKGIRADAFLDICRAYVNAHQDGKLTTPRQQELAMKSAVLLAACAKVGLDALIDEATGYQYERAEDALQVKLRAYVLDELRDWEKTFPDALWEEFGRLTNWSGPLHSRPRWWGKLVLALIYDALDPDVANHLRTTKPTPQKGQNYHQWLTEDIGLQALITHIHQVIGIAKTCNTMNELREKVAFHYGKKPVQLPLELN